MGTDAGEGDITVVQVGQERKLTAWEKAEAKGLEGRRKWESRGGKSKDVRNNRIRYCCRVWDMELYILI